ncbi:hypothetical protein MN608_02454 [Microdochium nivale]|nr:hypothetical protein MN608_02454 [Microdochium nivale]
MTDCNTLHDLQAGHWTSVTTSRRPGNVRRSWIGDHPTPRGKAAHARVGGPHIRHESSESLSSIKSSSSAPGLTDTSDSEPSVDEDSQYNISTSQLWDSFWQSVELKSTSRPTRPPPKIQSVQSDDYFTLSVLNHYTQDTDDEQNDEDDDNSNSIITTRNSVIRKKPLAAPQPLSRPTTSSQQSHQSSSRPSSPNRPNRSYSIYPKQKPFPSTRQLVLPPRTSSRTSPLPPIPQPPVPQLSVREQKVSGLLLALRPSRSSHNLHVAHSEAVAEARPPVPLISQSAPTSPSLPNPLYTTLRPSKSTFNLKQKRADTGTQHNPTAPLAPLAPLVPLVPFSSLDRPLPELPHDRPSMQRFVSVFELDSDCESDAESNNGLAKRIARGLHKKTPSGRRNVLPGPVRRPVTAGQDAPVFRNENAEEAKNALARRRGGSLGRIFGLKFRH